MFSQTHLLSILRLAKVTMAQIDHLVLLLSTPDFENPPPWLSDNFTIIEGGTHTGQASRNKLIFFKDGTYLELFNWFDIPPNADDEKQPMRVWGQKHPGLIDFALTSTGSPEEYVGALNQRVEGNQLGVAYEEPVPGGRKRTDGVDVKWKVSRPKFQVAKQTPNPKFFPGGRLDAPFFCHDVTERRVRVLFDDEHATRHECGAVGISEVRVLVPPGKLEYYASLYMDLCGVQDNFTAEHHSADVPIAIATPVSGDKMSSLVVWSPYSTEDKSRIQERGIGISDVVLSTDQSGQRAKKQLDTHGIASTLWLK